MTFQLVVHDRVMGNFDTEADLWQAFVEYQAACIVEGFCPTHDGVPLDRHERPGYCGRGRHVWTVDPAHRADRWVSETFVGE